ncbi:hypothetical protein [Nostoc sp. CHAB 5715]|uniref:hypothetical protein n=1 Tax=Nostoc sp. CHAB 5715 TaxID=2780400 RepID=UPI001E329320|nr:hypothetical protein [Nostoc sp. CHAB 5715]MCC5620069.1 hypothetical protein [Nostoc sp. CHAB 5715]
MSRILYSKSVSILCASLSGNGAFILEPYLHGGAEGQGRQGSRGAGEAGQAGQAGGKGKNKKLAFSPLPHAQCPMPHAQCPILRLRSVQVPNAQCPVQQTYFN